MLRTFNSKMGVNISHFFLLDHGGGTLVRMMAITIRKIRIKDSTLRDVGVKNGTKLALTLV